MLKDLTLNGNVCSQTILHTYIFPLGKLLHLVMLHNRSYHRMVENVGCLLREKKKKEKKQLLIPCTAPVLCWWRSGTPDTPIKWFEIKYNNHLPQKTDLSRGHVNFLTVLHNLSMCISDAEMSVVCQRWKNLCKRSRWNKTENTDRSAVVQKPEKNVNESKVTGGRERKSSTYKAALHQKTRAKTGELSATHPSITISTGNVCFHKCHFLVSLE